MADAGVGEAMLLAETLGESYAVPGIMESSAAMLGESYAVPGIMPGTSSLMGGSSPYAMFGADMAGAGYPEMSAYGLPDLIGESYAVPGTIPGAPESPYGMYTANALGTGYPDFGGIKDLLMRGGRSALNWATEGQRPYWLAGGSLLAKLMADERKKYGVPRATPYTGALSKFKYDPFTFSPTVATPNVYMPRYAEGGVSSLPTGPVERLSQQVVGAGGMYPQSQMDKTYFATPTQMPASAEVIGADYDARTNPYTGTMMADGGIASIGGYSDGGRMLKGPGDGMSDSIPGTIEGKQPARLADGEFVVPADVVSHLGNGSTDAGAKRLYGMMDKVRKARTGTKKQGRQIKPEKYMPA